MRAINAGDKTMTQSQSTEETMFSEFRDGLIGIIVAYEQGRPEGTAQGDMLYHDVRMPYNEEVVLYRSLFGIPESAGISRSAGVVEQLCNLRRELITFDTEVGAIEIEQAIEQLNRLRLSSREIQRGENIYYGCRDYARLFEISCGEASDLITNGISAHRQDLLSPALRASNGRSALQALRTLAEQPINAESLPERLLERRRINQTYLYDEHERYEQYLQRRGLQITRRYRDGCYGK